MKYGEFEDQADVKYSREVDYGVQWIRGLVKHPRYRISWVQNTGQLYAIRDVFDKTNEPVIFLGKYVKESDAERFMSGWSDLCGEPRSLDIIMERAGLTL